MRLRERLFVAEGIRLGLAAHESGASIRAAVVAPDFLRSDRALRLVESLRASGAEILEVSADVFRSFSSRDNPQGLAIVAEIEDISLDKVEIDRGLCQVALNEPQDPGNVGTILRTCDGVGAGALILLEHSVDPYDPRAVRASMGAIFTRRIVHSTLRELTEWSEHNGCDLIAVTGSGEIEYRAYVFRKPLILLMGSERQGLPTDAHVKASVFIPMSGAVDSLNLSVATGLLLYEVFHQLR